MFDEPDDEPETNIDLVGFLKGKGWISRTEMHKHFNCANPKRDSHKKIMDYIFNELKENNNIEWNRELKNKAKYRYINSEPEIIEFNQEELEGLL